MCCVGACVSLYQCWGLRQSRYVMYVQCTGVPAGCQRLLFRGMLLQGSRTLLSYNIGEESALCLVANREEAPLSAPQDEYKKHRYYQQRSHGLQVRRGELMEVLEQANHMIGSLVGCASGHWEDSVPFKLQAREKVVGEWVDVRDGGGVWREGQVMGEREGAVCVRVGDTDTYMWVEGDRVMPFRTHTVQPEHASYMSPMPQYTPAISNATHHLTTILSKLRANMESVIKLMQIDDELPQSIQNESFEMKEERVEKRVECGEQQEVYLEEKETKEQYETPSKKELGDNLSNKCEDDISNTGDKDDISNKSFKSKRSQGRMQTTSMRRARKPRQNIVFYDHSEQAQSVRSVKANIEGFNRCPVTQQYIPEEQNSFQQEQEHVKGKKNELQSKIKASQLAPLCDRLGRLLMDIAPLFAMMGHTDQAQRQTHENLSTCTNEGSLESKMKQMKVRFQQDVERREDHVKSREEISPSLDHIQLSSKSYKKNYCQFQIPVMLTPLEAARLTHINQQEKRQNIGREY